MINLSKIQISSQLKRGPFKRGALLDLEVHGRLLRAIAVD